MDRPIIGTFDNISDFLRDMIRFQKQSIRGFSVHRRCKGLRRLSPALVSQIANGNRRLTLDRVPVMAVLLKLTPEERQYLMDWVTREEVAKGNINGLEDYVDENVATGRRRFVSDNILKDWLNVYVKDAFRIKSVMKKIENLYSVLAGVASKSRIDRCLKFLLTHGYLRRRHDGSIVEDTPLTVTDEKIPNLKVKAFHKKTLEIARRGIDLYGINERVANALIVPLDEEGYVNFCDAIDAFAKELQQMAMNQSKPGDRLYQCIVNLSPIGDRVGGGSLEGANNEGNKNNNLNNAKGDAS